MIVLMAGLPGTGKTTLAKELSSRLGGRILSKDEFRHALFHPDEVEYSSQQDDFCLQLMLETAGYLLSRDPKKVIFLDGRPFSRCYQIENVISSANSLHQQWRILQCVCSEDLAKQRLSSDVERKDHPAGNRDFQLYLAVKDRFETITYPKTVIDTGQQLDTCIQLALKNL